MVAGYNYYSHIYGESEAKLLKQHLLNTAKLSINKSSENEKYVNALTAAFHDFGKYSILFQNYLRGNGKRVVHAYVGAVAAYHAIMNSLKDKESAYYAYLSVVNHHGTIREISIINRNYLESGEYSWKNLLKDFLSNISINDIVIEYEWIFKNLGLDISVNVADIIRQIKIDISDNENFAYPILEDSFINNRSAIKLRRMFSILIDSDKKDASRTKDMEADLNSEKLKFIKPGYLLGGTMSHMRNLLWDVVGSRVDLLNKYGIVSLSAPTGSGKTLAVMNALSKIEADRYIYVLPFRSLVEQTYDVAKSVFKNNTVIKHHAMASIDDIDEWEEDESKKVMHLESWDAKVIITTAEQFFDSIFFRSNKLLKKFHTLRNSIVVFDEFHSLPYSHWRGLFKLLQKMYEELNMRSIIMTATQPFIKEEKNLKDLAYGRDEKSHKLVEEFNKLNRYKLVYDSKELLVDNFLDSKKHIIKNNLSTAIVVNTIKSAIAIYKQIKENFRDHHVYYLASNLLPLDKEGKIRKIKKHLQNKEKTILVSTQVIEAGIDLDFDVIFRDIAPLSSLIQTAGRANRENTKGISKIYIIKLIDNQRRLLATKVYNSDDISKTVELLENEKEIYEMGLHSLYKKYSKILARKTGEFIDEIVGKWYKMEQLESQTEKKLKLIEEGGKVSIFILYNEEARQLWNMYEQNKLSDYDKRRFFKYIVSVWAKGNYEQIQVCDKDNYSDEYGYIEKYYEII